MKISSQEDPKVHQIKNMAEFRTKVVDLIEENGTTTTTALTGFTLVEVGCNLLLASAPNQEAAEAVIEKAIEVAKQEHTQPKKEKKSNV